MNKSKFLKKSLAALLAVMLVVAMIPLSAAAATPLPNLSQLYVNNKVVNIEGDGATFKANIGRGDTSVDLRVDKTAMEYQGSPSVFEMRAVKDDKITSAAISEDNATNTPIAFSDWATENTTAQVTIKLRVIHKADYNPENADTFKDYTLVLTRTDKNPDAVLESVSHDMGLPGDTGVYEATLNESTNTVEVNVARKATKPTITLKGGQGSTVNCGAKTGSSITVQLAGTGNNMADAFDTPNATPITKEDAFYVTSEDGKNRVDWNIKVTFVDAMMSFALGEDPKFDASIEDKYQDPASVTSINNTTPTPTDKFHDTITVEIDQSLTVDADGVAKDHVILPVNFQAHGNVSQVRIQKHGDSTSLGDANSTVRLLKPGDKYDFGKITTTTGFAGTLLVEVDGAHNGQIYNLFVNVKKSDDKTITFATIDGQIAKIEGTKISAKLPTYVKGTTNTTDLSKVEVVLVTANTLTGGKVNLVTDPADATWSSAPDTISGASGRLMWTAQKTNPHDAKVDLRSSKTITVTAQDGSILQYEISASMETDSTTAVLNSITLEDNKTGKQYTGTIQDNTVTFTVPYMTISVKDWKLYATANEAAYIVVPNSGTEKEFIPGADKGATLATTASVNGIDENTNGLATTSNTNKGKIIVRNKNNSERFTNYEVIINLEKPVIGNKLTSLQYSAQTVDPDDVKYSKIAERVTSDNSVTAVIDQEKNTITYKPPFSLSTDVVANVADSYIGEGNTTAGLWNIVTHFTAEKGAVPFLCRNDAVAASTTDVIYVTPMVSLADIKDTTTSFSVGDNGTTASTVSLISEEADISGNARDVRVLVLPEEKARKAVIDGFGAKGSGNAYFEVSKIVSDNGGKLYTLTEDPQSPSTKSAMLSMKIKDTTLNIATRDSADGEGRIISGTLPYSYTVAAYTTTDTSAIFPEFTLDKFAAIEGFNSKGDIDGDGEAEAFNATTNKKLLFVRNADHTLSVYALGSTDADTDVIGTKDAPLTVKAEDRLKGTVDYSKTDYKFDLKWADPNPNADITSFKVGGSTGSINGYDINVTVPFLTNLRSQVVEFTTSPQATVKVGNTELVSGKSTLNVTANVTLTVTSEDGKRTQTYVLKVKEGEMFTDIHQNDWFYDVVLKAATEGWINGRGNGIFDPYANMTRAEFANIIAKMENFNAAAYTESRFPDVPDDHFAKAAIAYCADMGYIQGVGDGNFDPGSPITREQAAIIMCKVNGIAPVDGETTYADNAKIAPWSKGYVKAATTAGIFEGEGDDFNPQRNLRRCEGAAILVRSANK